LVETSVLGNISERIQYMYCLTVVFRLIVEQ